MPTVPMPRRLVARAGLVALTGLAVATVAGAATSGSGNVVTETRAVTGFSALALRGGIDLVVRQGAAEGVTVRGEDNIVPLVQTTLEGSGEQRTLRIQFKPGESIRTHQKVEVTVDVVQLRALSAAGSGEIRVQPLKAPALALSISGSSNARFEQLDVGSFTIGVAGSGDVAARGKAGKVDVSIAGSGDVRVRELAAETVSISIAGSGDASVNATKTLDVSIAGSGDVDYSGGAALSKRIAGSGSVRQRP
ncbi:MAG TPA: head GIN domain-containing protein [Burkholderiaceae bacterium]|nr:head GIN domain-containing protein [Burkholderiaceae bacterium]